MLTKLQAAKLERRFELLDLDGTGYIGAAHYEHAAANVCRAFDYPESSVPGEKIRIAYQDLWIRLSAQVAESHGGYADGRRVNGSGPAAAKISREQFVTACARDILEPEDGYDAVKRPSVDTIFGLIDTRGRGALTLGELTTWFNAYGVCADDAERALRALDRDGDGDLSHDEVNDAVRAFYCATDSDTPANKLFGPF